MPLCPRHAGVKLAPGSYNVTPNSNDGHIYMSCAAARTAAFEIDLSLTTLTFTVSTATGSYSCTSLMTLVLSAFTRRAWRRPLMMTHHASTVMEAIISS